MLFNKKHTTALKSLLLKGFRPPLSDASWPSSLPSLLSKEVAFCKTFRTRAVQNYLSFLSCALSWVSAEASGMGGIAYNAMHAQPVKNVETTTI